MALFPKCSFGVDVTRGVIVPGERFEGTLVLEVPEDIARVEHIDLELRSEAWAGYGGGKTRSVVRRTMFVAPFKLDLPKDRPLAAGTHGYPFAIDLPAWLPPAMRGSDCAIQHRLTTHLSVDWARDPDATLLPNVTLPPVDGVRAGVTVRSPRGFHEEVVLEITLASNVLALGEALEGQVALRGGANARFDAVTLDIVSAATIVMHSGDERHVVRGQIRIPAAMMRTGEAVPFRFPLPPDLPPTFRTSFIDHDVQLAVRLDIPWAGDPGFILPLNVLPRGSRILGEGLHVSVGSERLVRLASAMARASGLAPGDRRPILASGNIGPVTVSILDMPRNAQLGAQLELTFPDLELGLVFRDAGMFSGASPMLPERMRARHQLRLEPDGDRPPAPPETVSAFAEAIFADVWNAEELRLSDHHLSAYVKLADDEEPTMVALARTATERAKVIAEAITALPFPAVVAHGRPTWQHFAEEHGAFLVPSGPSIHGLVLRARVTAGDERTLGTTIRTGWSHEGPALRVDVDLRGAPLLAKTMFPTKETLNAKAMTVRAAFPGVTIAEDGL
ncbi:MAG: sporulation protein, partial [Polyangiaceae bacterium]